MINLIMPMAGDGIRVKDAGIAKPLIPISGIPMFCWALESVNVPVNYIFIVRDNHVNEYGIDRTIAQYFPSSKVIVQNGRLNGPAHSVMEARDLITDAPLIIMDCDMYLNIDYTEAIKAIGDFDGGIGTFLNTSPQYSYISRSESGLIDDIKEKEVIGSEAVAGSYFWSEGTHFVNYYSNALKTATPNKELYISDVYKKALRDNKKMLPILAKYCYDMSTKEGMDNFMLNRGLLDLSR